MNRDKISKQPFRAWFYFRNGWSLYFAFIFAAINTLTVTYYLAIDKIPYLLEIFPTFSQYVVTVVLIGVPSLVFIGYIHYKRSPAYKSEATIGFEVNPYIRRNLVNSEINLQINLKILDIVLKLESDKKLSDEELSEIKEIRSELLELIDKRTISNKFDLDYLKKLIDKK